MKNILFTLLAIIIIGLGCLLLGDPTSLIPSEPSNFPQAFSDQINPANDDTNTSITEEAKNPKHAEGQTAPALNQNNQPSEYPSENEALDAAGLIDALTTAYYDRKSEFELVILKDSFNEREFAAAIKEINKSSKDTNYFIARYEFRTRGLSLGNTLKLALILEYKEVINGYNAGSSDAVPINSYEDFEKLVKTGMEQTQEKIKYKFINNSLDASVEHLLKLLEKVAEANRGNYVEKYGLQSFGNGGYININYFYPSNQVKDMKNVVNNKVQAIISSTITPEMSELDKERALHDYIVLNTKYDKDNFEKNTVPKDSYTAYGTLIKGVAVCEGYASAMDLLLKAAGIESRIVTGNANNGSYNGPHAWNVVNIDGNWQFVDVTWDDPVPDHAGVVRHDYFNLTEQEIRKDHTF